MNRTLAAAVMMLLTIAFLASFATTFVVAQTASSEPTLKPEDVRQIREAAKAINDILRSDQKSTDTKDAKQGDKKDEEGKSMADVADRALSILSGYIGSAAQAMQKVAPEVWRVMIRQQYANAVAGPLLPLALIGFTVLYVVTLKRWWDKSKVVNNSDEASARFIFTSLVPFVSYVVCGIWASITIRGSIQMLINPEYYAFRDLLQLVLRSGGL